MSIIQGNTKVSAAGYDIPQSIRFNSADSAYLTRTPSSTGDQKKWTTSLWFKRCKTGVTDYLMTAGQTSTNDGIAALYIDSSDDTIHTYFDSSGAAPYGSVNARKLRDPSAFYHIIWAVDAVNTIQRIWLNGEELTLNAARNPPNFAYDMNASGGGKRMAIGAQAWGFANYANIYAAEIHHLDGQYITDPTTFGEYNSITGVWTPIKVTGQNYGVNGFYITGADSADLGADYSGNSPANDFSSFGLTTADQVIDTPSDSFATLSRIDSDSSVVLSDGNLGFTISNASATYAVRSTVALPSSGKWYWEFTNETANPYLVNYGILSTATPINANGTGDAYLASYSTYGPYNNGIATVLRATSFTSWAGMSGPSAANDVAMIAVDMDNGTMWFGKNGTWWNTSGTADPATNTDPRFSSISGEYAPVVSGYYSTYPNLKFNFGATAFAYTPPTGFKALSTKNLPEPTIKDGSAYFQTSLWSGNSSTQEINQTGNSTFQPDLVWFKSRSTTYNHQLQDAVRGVGNVLFSNLTNAEGSYPSTITSLDADGFTLGSDAGANQSGQTYVGWQWLAGNGTSQNADGSITSTVSVNQTAKFSIATFTAPASGTFSVGHGLGAVPKFTTLKRRDSATGGNWQTWHIGLGDNLTDYLFLSTSGAEASYSTMWGTDGRTSSVCGFTIGGSATGNGTYVLYSFAEVEGFSKFGSYTGNGSANGPFVWCGFRPAWVMLKQTNTANNWIIYDAARDTYNYANKYLYADATSAEATYQEGVDLLSNGFKLRHYNFGNTSGGTYVFMAFAENPFKYANAR